VRLRPFGVCDFSHLAVTDWRLRRWRLWFLALMTATRQFQRESGTFTFDCKRTPAFFENARRGLIIKKCLCLSHLIGRTQHTIEDLGRAGQFELFKGDRSFTAETLSGPSLRLKGERSC